MRNLSKITIGLLTLTILTGCDKKPQFSYGQKVEVKDGFYKGCIGMIRGMTDISDIEYYMELDCQTIYESMHTWTWVKEDDLL